MKASKVLTMSVSIFQGRILWRFSLSKNNISPAAPDLELILFPLWYWPIMNAHTKQQDGVSNRFYWQSKIQPPFAHLLALSHIHYSACSSKQTQLLLHAKALATKFQREERGDSIPGNRAPAVVPLVRIDRFQCWCKQFNWCVDLCQLVVSLPV